MTPREEFITSLRQLADFLTVNPDVPVPESYTSTSIQVSAIDGNDDEKRRTVDAAALAMGVEPFDPSGDGTRWKALLAFGQVQYQVLAIDTHEMAESRERDRLGRAAWAAKKAAEADVIDVEVVEAPELNVPLHCGEPVEIHAPGAHDHHVGLIEQPDEEGGFEVAVDGVVRHFERSELEVAR